jgi:uracil phosphoribosyltransferase
MEEALRECCRDVRIGKILIQRDKSGERRVCLGDPHPTPPTHIHIRRVSVGPMKASFY